MSEGAPSKSHTVFDDTCRSASHIALWLQTIPPSCASVATTATYLRNRKRRLQRGNSPEARRKRRTLAEMSSNAVQSPTTPLRSRKLRDGIDPAAKPAGQRHEAEMESMSESGSTTIGAEEEDTLRALRTAIAVEEEVTPRALRISSTIEEGHTPRAMRTTTGTEEEDIPQAPRNVVALSSILSEPLSIRLSVSVAAPSVAAQESDSSIKSSSFHASSSQYASSDHGSSNHGESKKRKRTANPKNKMASLACLTRPVNARQIGLVEDMPDTLRVLAQRIETYGEGIGVISPEAKVGYYLWLTIMHYADR